MEFENLSGWNPWWKNKDILSISGVERETTKEITRLVSMRHIKILSGVRRSGKSTILYQVIRFLLEKGVKPENVLFMNMEDESLLTADFDALLDLYLEHLDPKGDIYLFIDEVQAREKWESWVRSKYDLRKFKQIFVSGSSLSLLSSKHASLLTGRQLNFTIHPLSFGEFLKFKGITVDLSLIGAEERAKIKSLLKEYLKHGGFPEVVLTAEKHRLLVEYYNNIVSKDIVAKHDLEERKVKDLMRYIISNIAQPHSYKKIANVIRLSATTVTSYLDYIENAFLLSQVPIFSYKIKDHLQHPRKIYCIDNGLVNSVSFQFSSNIGNLYENTVFLELKRRFEEVYYWRSEKHEEVDFVIKEGLKVRKLLQVCYDASSKGTKSREITALLKAMNEFKLKESIVITGDYESVEIENGFKIHFIPLWKWLLE